ncbi:Bcr/CflA family multidrug efflux MFS transporter [Sansalvadorimonas verongulae]|uniref:Bcr/CflA family multidrug efflux MFS transporter n=1 Tax=Sansalvadorimonas verongulae TaxID=2172824 RepID=UPI0012BC11CC|nr:Bcr/CflA family multidrug efflux MFS transporter [Sansalvadorimonas verongulae]MTI14438.1 Bcr/CflA family multidrug efflux MFS transporter [Sansalvadorimonas verongulae]
MTNTEFTLNRRLLVLILGTLTCLGPLAIDLYLPAMPEIARSMGEPLGRIQLTLSAYTIGFALGQVVFGPLSDRYGRMKIILPGLVGYVITNILSSMATTANELILIRCLQALAGAAVMVCIPAMVRDIFPRQECAKVLSSILLVMTVAPLAAPILGGQILRFADWPALFWFMAAAGVVAFALAFLLLKESLPEERRTQMNPRQLVQAYTSVLTHRQAMSCILAHGFFFGGMFAFVSGSPFVYIELYGVPADQYGYLFGLNILGMGLCNFINMRLMGRLPLKKLLRFGCYTAGVAGLILIFNAGTGFGGLAGIVVPAVMFVSCMGFTGPNSNALALENFPKIAGTANAAAGVLRFGIGGISAGLAGLLHNGTAVPMAGLMAGCAILSVLCLTFVGGKQNVEGDADHPELEVDMPVSKAA